MVQAAAPNLIRDSQGRYIGVERGGDMMLYSAALVVSNQSAPLFFFSYSLGQTVIGASGTNADERHTNIDFDAKHVPNNVAMAVYGVSFEVPTDIGLAALRQLIEQLYLSFSVSGSKPVFGGLARMFPQGNSGIAGVSTADAVEIYSNGALNASRFNFKYAMGLESGKQFEAKGEVKGALTMANANQLCRLIFRGEGVRPV